MMITAADRTDRDGAIDMVDYRLYALKHIQN